MRQIYKTRKIIHTRHPHTHVLDRRHVIQRIARSAHQAGDVSMHRRISQALPAIRVAFAPGVPVVTCTCIFCTSSRQQDRRHVNPSFTIHCWHLPSCTSKFLSARCRAHSLRLLQSVLRPKPLLSPDRFHTLASTYPTQTHNHVFFFNTVLCFFF